LPKSKGWVGAGGRIRYGPGLLLKESYHKDCLTESKGERDGRKKIEISDSHRECSRWTEEVKNFFLGRGKKEKSGKDRQNRTRD